MTLSSGTKVMVAALAVAAPIADCFLNQRPILHSNFVGRNNRISSDVSSKPHKTADNSVKSKQLQICTNDRNLI